MKRAFNMKQKALFIIFKGFPLSKIISDPRVDSERQVTYTNTYMVFVMRTSKFNPRQI